MARKSGKRALGSVIARKRKDGTITWSAVAYYGRDELGKQIRRWSPGHHTKRDAERKLAEMNLDQNYVRSDKETVKDLISNFISSKEVAAERSTTGTYWKLLIYYITPFIGGVRADKLTPEQLNALYVRLQRHGAARGPVTGTTARHTHNLIRAAYNWARKLRKVSSNPALDANPPKRSKTRGKALKSSSLQEFLDRIEGHRYEAPMLFAMATAVRRGELCGLRWDDVDFRARTVVISQAIGIDPRNRDLYVKHTKNDEPRSIPLNDVAIGALKMAKVNRARWKLKAGALWEESGLVFTDEFGRIIDPDYLSGQFRRWKQGRRYNFRLHDLRHNAASQMLA